MKGGGPGAQARRGPYADRGFCLLVLCFCFCETGLQLYPRPALDLQPTSCPCLPNARITAGSQHICLVRDFQLAFTVTKERREGPGGVGRGRERNGGHVTMSLMHESIEDKNLNEKIKNTFTFENVLWYTNADINKSITHKSFLQGIWIVLMISLVKL